jgi:hypothetical protein
MVVFRSVPALNVKVMALDLHVLENGHHTKLLYQIQHDQYMRMEPAIDLLKRRTGIYINQYSDTKFSSGLKPLIQTLKECVPEDKKSLTARKMISLIDVLEEAERNETPVIFVGD